MNIYIISIGLFMTVTLGEAIKCYHCFDAFQNTTNGGNISNIHESQRNTLVRCDKNKLKWNTWECPSAWPICVIVSGTVRGNIEVVRTCAKKDFCSLYVPPSNVKLEYCQECNTTLCNDYPTPPNPPINPGPLFQFNININLNLKKYPVLKNENDEVHHSG